MDANFKEVQLRNIRIGQPVKLTADLYGKKVEYDGKVAGLGVGTGAAFALANPFNSDGAFSDDRTTGKLDGLASEEADKGKFRTKHLRQIAGTARTIALPSKTTEPAVGR